MARCLRRRPRRRRQEMAHDVTTFLAWAAEPTLEERKRTGWKVMIFLPVCAGVFRLKRKIWADPTDGSGPVQVSSATVIGIIGGSGIYQIDGRPTSSGAMSLARKPSRRHVLRRLDGQQVISCSARPRSPGAAVPRSISAPISTREAQRRHRNHFASAVGSTTRQELAPAISSIVDQS